MTMNTTWKKTLKRGDVAIDGTLGDFQPRRNRLRRQVFHSALCGALAINQLIVRDPLVAQIPLHQRVILRGNPQPEPMIGPKLRRHCI